MLGVHPIHASSMKFYDGESTTYKYMQHGLGYGKKTSCDVDGLERWE